MTSEPNEIGQWYRRAFAAAALAAGLPPEPSPGPLVIKLLEETIELALAFGLTSANIQQHFYRALNKEDLKIARGEPLGEPLAEFVDLAIVMAALAEVAAFDSEAIDEAIDEKMEINELREWRVNEFGALSHKRKAPQERQP